MPEIGNTAVFSQTDASNNAGTVPSWEEGMAPSKVNDSARALQGAITREWNWRNYTLTSGGSADVHTLSYSVAPAAYYNGQRFGFIAGFTNATTTPTLNVNSLGAVTMKKMSAGVQSALAAGDITAGNFYEAVYNSSGSAFIITVGIGSAPTAATTTQQLTGTSTTVFSTPDSIAALWEKGSDVASAGTISLGEGGYFHITGTTTITDIDFATAKDGRTAFCVFDGALTLTHNATTLILPTGANITTAAGDAAVFVQDSGDNVKCVSYQRASGTSLVGSCIQLVNSQTASVTTSATAIPHDNTIPQNTEGVEVLSKAITPKSSTNTLVIDVTLMLASSVANEFMEYALFQDATANAIAAGSQRPAAVNTLHTVTFRYVMTAGTTSSTTFKVRIGPSVGTTTLTLNGESGAGIYGGVVNSSITITEYT